jgi:hypothetical protein
VSVKSEARENLRGHVARFPAATCSAFFPVNYSNRCTITPQYRGSNTMTEWESQTLPKGFYFVTFRKYTSLGDESC